LFGVVRVLVGVVGVLSQRLGQHLLGLVDGRHARGRRGPVGAVLAAVRVVAPRQLLVRLRKRPLPVAARGQAGHRGRAEVGERHVDLHFDQNSKDSRGSLLYCGCQQHAAELIIFI
jgi:hypothetical protein